MVLSGPQKRLVAWSFASVLVLFASAAAAQFGGFNMEKASFELMADRSSYAPGSTVRLLASMEIEEKWHVNGNRPTLEFLIPTELFLELPAGASAPTFEYPAAEMKKFAFGDEPIAVYEGQVWIQSQFELPSDLVPGSTEILASLRYQACDDSQCLPPVTAEQILELSIGEEGAEIHASLFASAGSSLGSTGSSTAGSIATSNTAASNTATASNSLLTMLFLALVGGFILNAMPCVLPVLSLKVFGLVKSAGQGRSALVSGALATTGGVLVSFWILALVVVMARSAGELIGWGNQFQYPGFVAFLAVVVVLFALNMWGLFEIILPQKLAQVAGGGSPREGIGGHFASGFFATLMATPCSAPFLGTAVGFALAQSNPTIFAIFTAVGVGLALPYLLLAAFPSIARFLPKPGPWMVKFKEVMGFLLAAAAVWLFYVLAGQIASESIAFIQLTLLLLALSAWLFGRSQGAIRRVAMVGMGVAAFFSIQLASQAPAKAGQGTQASKLIDWVAFDKQEAERLTTEGKLVFVDVTADWCLTCKTTERLVIETKEVAEAFETHDVVAMKADWTNRDDRITQFLAGFGKSAVPFYVLYRPQKDPYPFGELLTQGRLIDALSEARSVAVIP